VTDVGDVDGGLLLDGSSPFIGEHGDTPGIRAAGFAATIGCYDNNLLGW
jgi:hypothetical protein